jgi:DNA-binding PadR family transcriptional regulator
LPDSPTPLSQPDNKSKYAYIFEGRPLTVISVSDISVIDSKAMPPNRSLSDAQRQLLPLTPAVFFILFALADGEKHGYAILQDVKVLSGGQVNMGPGTLYTTIQRLLDLALIMETTEPKSDGRRRYYQLSGAGKVLLEVEIGRMHSLLRLARQKNLKPLEAR